tara:strand:+ start:1494 stop:2033 length:540 start_codon:yes stop_codon:yes gene_type:complete
MKSNTVQILTTVLSNAAVLAGVVFLVIELKQNSEIALSEMTQERALAFVDQQASYATDKDFATLHAKVFIRFDFDSVTKEEWDQMTLYSIAERARLRDVWGQGSRGLIDQLIYDAALSKSARHLQLWQWLKIAPTEETPFYAAIFEKAKAEDFNDKDQGLPFMAEFAKWVKDKKSPHEI